MLTLTHIIKSFLGALRQPVVALAIINVFTALIAFVKDIMLAAYLGTTLQADALALASFIPDSIGNNMFAAAISVGCIPVYSRLVVLEQYHRLRLSFKYISIRFLLVSVLLVLIGYGFSGIITGWLNGSESTELELATLPLLQLLLPSIVMFVVIANGTSILQTMKRFIIPATAPLLFNFIFLGGVVYCSFLGIAVEKGVSKIAIAIMLGVCLMTIWIVAAWYRVISQLHVSQDLNLPLIKKHLSSDWLNMLQIFVPYLVILFSLQAVYLAERYLVTAFDSGTTSALNYAFRLTQLPIWVFVSAVSIVILPSLSRHLALGELKKASMVMANAFRGVVLIVLPSMLFLFLLREPLIIALFQRGAFDARSVVLTTSILEGYSLSVLSQAISLVCLRYFLASKQLVLVLSIYASTAFITILLDIWLSQVIGPRGIGYGAALGALLNAILLIYMLFRRLRPSIPSIVVELSLYGKVLIMPVVFFTLCMIVWTYIPYQNSEVSLIFVLLSGSLFLVIYYYVLRRFWPDLFISMNIKWGKG